MPKYIGKRIADGVYETDQYNIFKFGNNRPISKSKVEKKKKSIKKMGLLTPIEVTSDYYIKEGQHRFMALKELGLPIIYRFALSDTFTVDEISEINSTTERWGTKDFVTVRANSGNESYIRIKKLLDKYPDTKWADIALTIQRNGNNKIVREGMASMTEEEFVKADALLFQSEKLYSLISGSPYASRKYFSVFINLLKFNLCSYEKLYDALNRRKQWLWEDRCKPGTVLDALTRIEFAYNYSRPQKYRIDIIKKYQQLTKIKRK